MPRRVSYVHFFPGLGGSAKSLLNLIRHLDRDRFEPSVLMVHPILGETARLFEEHDIPVVHEPTTLVWDAPGYSLASLCGRAWRAFRPDPRIARRLEELAPDIVHVNDFPALAAGLAAREVGLRVVWHMRHVMRAHPFSRLGRRVVQRIEGSADHVIAISESEAGQFRRPERVSVVYNSVDASEIRAAADAPADLRAELGLADDALVFLAPIALTFLKGAWDFLEAAALCSRATEAPVHFVMAGAVPAPGRRHLLRKWTRWLGPEPSGERAQRRIRELDLEGRFHFLGFRRDVYAVMSAADVVVFPARLHAHGRPVLEGAALGKPVVATAPRCPSRILLDRRTGLLVPEGVPAELARAFVELAESAELRTEMGRAGSTHAAECFDAAEQARQVMSIYDRVLR